MVGGCRLIRTKTNITTPAPAIDGPMAPPPEPPPPSHHWVISSCQILRYFSIIFPQDVHRVLLPTSGVNRVSFRRTAEFFKLFFACFIVFLTFIFGNSLSTISVSRSCSHWGTSDISGLGWCGFPEWGLPVWGFPEWGLPVWGFPVWGLPEWPEGGLTGLTGLFGVWGLFGLPDPDFGLP